MGEVARVDLGVVERAGGFNVDVASAGAVLEVDCQCPAIWAVRGRSDESGLVRDNAFGVYCGWVVDEL